MQLRGSESAPAKGNEASQKNDIGTAKDDISLAVVNAKMQGMENAYVENGVSASEAQNTVGRTVIQAVADKYATNNQIGKATVTVDVEKTNNVISDNATISISTRDFVIEGTITLKDGVLTWGEIEPNVPRISGVPETLTLDTGSNYTINAKLKGITGSISWSSNKPSIASVSNGEITTALSMTNPTEQVTITASADGCESKTCILTVTKTMPLAKNILIVTVENEGEENETVTSEKYVYYPMSNGKTIKCRVLYNDEQHGLQIITEGLAQNTSNQNITVELGKNVGSDTEQSNLNNYSLTYKNCTIAEFSKAKNSYNNLVKNLNDAAYGLMNTNLSEYARCVGSSSTGTPIGQPTNNPTADNSAYFNTSSAKYNSSYAYLTTKGLLDGTYRDEDTNYKEDQRRLTKINAWKLSNTYWLASRQIDTGSISTDFNALNVFFLDGGIYKTTLCQVCSKGEAYCQGEGGFGLRPIFYLKSNVKISGGQGTSDSPYELFVE